MPLRPDVHTVILPDGRVFQFQAEERYILARMPPPDMTDMDRDLLPPPTLNPYTGWVAVVYEARGKDRFEWSPGYGRFFDTPQQAVADGVSRLIEAFWKE